MDKEAIIENKKRKSKEEEEGKTKKLTLKKNDSFVLDLPSACGIYAHNKCRHATRSVLYTKNMAEPSNSFNYILYTTINAFILHILEKTTC